MYMETIPQWQVEWLIGVIPSRLKVNGIEELTALIQILTFNGITDFTVADTKV